MMRRCFIVARGQALDNQFMTRGLGSYVIQAIRTEVLRLTSFLVKALNVKSYLR